MDHQNYVHVTGEVDRVREFQWREGTGYDVRIRLYRRGRPGTWIGIVCFQGDNVDNVVEGDVVEIEGQLDKERNWTDRQGNTRYGQHNIVAEYIRKRDGGSSKGGKRKSKPKSAGETAQEIIDSDIPEEFN